MLLYFTFFSISLVICLRKIRTSTWPKPSHPDTPSLPGYLLLSHFFKWWDETTVFLGSITMKEVLVLYDWITLTKYSVRTRKLRSMISILRYTLQKYTVSSFTRTNKKYTIKVNPVTIFTVPWDKIKEYQTMLKLYICCNYGTSFFTDRRNSYFIIFRT